MAVRHILLAILAFTPPANAVELHHVTVRTGTDGLDPVPLTVSNGSPEALSCNADFAHWYSAEIATAPSGGNADIDLWFDPKTGTYTILNDSQENLPVERLWCGFAGRAYATRAQIALDRGAQVSVAPLHISCVEATGRLVCE